MPVAFVMLMAAATMHLTTAVAASASSRRSTERAKADGARLAAGSVRVTIDYKGKGTVDSSHRVFVWLFNSPDIGPGSIPVAELTVDKNGGTATFEGVVDERVWIAVAYDERGVMTGAAPPPSGTPVGLYVGNDGAPRAVVPADSTAAVVTFDDSIRMP
jgi:hypothetical protein